VVKFRKDSGHDDWPCIINGDFNFAPDDPTYSLLVGDPLLPAQVDALAASRVVHVTVDPDVPPTTAVAPAEEKEGDDVLANHPDRIITNARPAIPSDGLLTIDELVDLYATPVRSAYEEGLTKHRASNSDVVTFGNHVPFESSRRGANEPEWTSYTHYWKTVLDYIFILDGSNSCTAVTGFAQPHRTEELEPGLPRKGVCGSDHISLSAEIIM
jgi:RNA exonuclease NGL2